MGVAPRRLGRAVAGCNEPTLDNIFGASLFRGNPNSWRKKIKVGVAIFVVENQVGEKVKSVLDVKRKIG